MGTNPDRYSEIRNHDSADGLHRYDLQDRYLKLVRHSPPAIARLKGWGLKEDHCFMRVILDQLFQDCWYNHLDRRLAAYKQLNNDQLRRAIALGTVIENGVRTRWQGGTVKVCFGVGKLASVQPIRMNVWLLERTPFSDGLC